MSVKPLTNRAITPVSVLVLSLGVGGAAIATYALDKAPWAQEWMPNIAVGALTIGLTVTIIDRALRRAEEHRVAPRVEVALRAMNAALYDYWRWMANMYARRNSKTYVRPLPTTLESWLTLLQDELDNVDDSPGLLYGRPAPEPVVVAQALRDSLVQIADRDSDVLPPALTGGIRDFDTQLNVLLTKIEDAQRAIAPNPESELRESVWRSWEEVKAVSKTYFEHGAQIPPELVEDINTSSENYWELRRQASSDAS